VVASDYSISVLLLDVLRRVHRDAPGMSLEFRNPSESAPAELEAGEVDFIVNPESQNSPLQSGAILFEDTYVIVVDAGNSEVGDSIRDRPVSCAAPRRLQKRQARSAAFRNLDG